MCLIITINEAQGRKFIKNMFVMDESGKVRLLKINKNGHRTKLPCTVTPPSLIIVI